jgi:hypothetical protein
MTGDTMVILDLTPSTPKWLRTHADVTDNKVWNLVFWKAS